jgi:ankyrin repeat protein
MLLVKGADVDPLRIDYETTALFIASREGHVKVVEKLLAHGANANLAT